MVPFCVAFQIGHLNMLMGNIKQAIKWLEIVNTRVMHDAGILAMLGSLHAKCDDEPKALHYYSESHRVYPTNMDITSWLGAFYVKNEVYEKAMPFFNLAAKIEPSEVT
jgi:intraflagellar transport protein 88